MPLQWSPQGAAVHPRVPQGAAVRTSLERGGGCPRAVEVDVLPAAVAALPDPRLLRLAGARPALDVHVLRQPDVRDAGRLLPHQVDVRVQDGGVDGLTVLSQD